MLTQSLGPADTPGAYLVDCAVAEDQVAPHATDSVSASPLVVEVSNK
jgi:hypothetical protein